MQIKKVHSTILLIIKNGAQSENYREKLAFTDFQELIIASQKSQIRELLDVHKPDLVICESDLEEKGDGILLADEIQRSLGTPVMFISNRKDKTTYRQAMQIRPWGFFTKPLKWMDLRAAIENVLFRGPLIQDPLARDRSSMKSSEGDPSAAEKEFMQLYEDAPLGYQSLNRDGSIRKVNAAWCRMMGLNAEEATGKYFGDLLAEDEKPLFKKRFKAFKKNKEVHDVLFHMIPKDGDPIKVSIDGRTIQDSRGDFLYSHCILKDISESTRIQEKIRESEELFRATFDHAGIAMAIIDPEGHFIEVNNKVTKILGYSRSEIRKMQYSQITHPEDLKISLANYQKILDNRASTYTVEKRYLHKNGHTVFGRLTLAAVRNAAGQLLYSVAQLVDITVSREAVKSLEASEERFRLLFDHSGQGIGYYDIHGKIIRYNRQASKLMGGTPEQFEGRSLVELFGKDAAELYRQRIIEVVASGKTQGFEDQVAVHGGVRWFHSSYTPVINEANVTTGVQVVSHDITESKDQALRIAEQERRWATLLDNLPGMAYQCLDDDHWTMIFVSKGASQLTGYQAESLINNRDLAFRKLIHPDDRKKVRQAIRRAGRQKYEITYKILTEKGEVKWVLERGRATDLKINNIKVLEGVIVDINDQKVAERELQEKSELLTSTGRMARVGSWELDLATNQVHWSEVTREIHEVQPDYRPDMKQAVSFYPEESRERLEEAIQNAIRTGEPYDLELEFMTHKGKKLFARTIGHPVYDNKDVIGLKGTFQDITENKKNRLELIALNQELAIHTNLLHQVLENTEDLIYVISTGNQIVRASKSGAEAFELKIHDLEGCFLGNTGFPKEFEVSLALDLQKVGKSNKSQRGSVGLQTSSGWKHIEYIISPLKQQGDALTHLLCTARDMTDQYNSELGLKQITEELSLVNNLNIKANLGGSLTAIIRQLSRDLSRQYGVHGCTFYSYDPVNQLLTAKVINLNPDQRRSIENITGDKNPPVKITLTEGGWYKTILDSGESRYTQSPEEILERSREFSQSKTVEKLLPSIIKALRIKCVLTIPVLKDNAPMGVLDISSNFLMATDFLQTMDRISASISNILSRRLAEDALVVSEDKYRTLFEMAPTVIASVDEEGRISAVNPALETVTGFKPGEVIKQPLSALKMFQVPHISSGVFPLAEKMAGKHSGPLEFQWKHSDGSSRCGEAYFTRLPRKGTRSGMQVMFNDTTERRAAEESMKKYTRMVQTTSDAIITTDPEGQITGWNRGAEVLYGFREKEALGKYIGLIYRKEDQDRLSSVISSVKRGKVLKDLDLICVAKDGRLVPNLLSVSGLHNADGEITELVGFSKDLTRLKEAEQTLRNSEKKYRSLFENMAQGAFYQLRDGSFLDVNKAALKMFGITKSQFLGRTSMHPDWKVVDEHGQALPGEKHPSMVSLRTGKNLSHKTVGIYNPKLQTYVWLSINTHLESQSDKKDPQQVFVTLHDLTAIKNAEKELLNRNTFIESIMENIPMGITVNRTDDMKVTYINKQMEEIYGWPRQEIRDMENFFHKVYPDPEYRKAIKDRVLRDVDSGNPEKMHWEQILVTGKDGSERYVNARNIPLYDQKLMISTAQDVTQSVRLQRQLQSSFETFRNLLYSNPSGIYIYKFKEPGSLILEQGNPAAEELTGIPNNEIEGKEFNDIWPNARKSGLTERYLRVARTGKTLVTEEIFYQDNRIRGYYRVHVFQVPDNRLAVAFENITQVKLAQHALMEERDRANQYLNIAASIILALDADGRITLINDEGAKLLQSTRKKLMGMNWFDHFLMAGEVDQTRNVFMEILKGNEKEYRIVEGPIRTAKGRVKTIRWQNSVIRDLDGKILGTLSSGEDISERKAAEEALIESEARYKDLVEKSGVAIVVDDTEGNIVYFNQDFARLFGYPVREMKTKQRSDLFTAAALLEIDRNHQKRMQGSKALKKYEMEGIRKDGARFWMEAKTSVLKESGRIKGTRNYIWDISERKEAEKALEESETRFRELFTRMQSGVLILEWEESSHGFIINSMNQSAIQILQLDSGQEESRQLLQTIPHFDHPNVQTKLREVMEQGTPLYVPMSKDNDHGLQYYLESHVYRLHSKEVVVVFDDGTKRVRAELELTKSYEEIRKLSRHADEIREEERKQIARNLHDELGQILTAVKMDISWIHKHLPDQLPNLIERSTSSLEIIDQAIKEIQQISAQLRPPVLDNLGLYEALKALAMEYEKRSKMQFFLSIPSKEGFTQPDFRISVYRLIQEFLTNAIRHSEGSEIHLVIEEKNNTLGIELWDDGIGISEKQMNSSDSLGLIGMKERVNHWNGTLRISKRDPKGTQIMATMPFPKEK